MTTTQLLIVLFAYLTTLLGLCFWAIGHLIKSNSAPTIPFVHMPHTAQRHCPMHRFTEYETEDKPAPQEDILYSHLLTNTNSGHSTTHTSILDVTTSARTRTNTYLDTAIIYEVTPILHMSKNNRFKKMSGYTKNKDPKKVNTIPKKYKVHTYAVINSVVQNIDLCNSLAKAKSVALKESPNYKLHNIIYSITPAVTITPAKFNSIK